MMIYITTLIKETVDKIQNNAKNTETYFSHDKNNEYQSRKKELN